MLGTKVGLGQGHIVLDGEPSVPPPSSSKRGAQQPAIFTSRLLWPKCGLSEQLLRSC